jgi:hypothetical protein
MTEAPANSAGIGGETGGSSGSDSGTLLEQEVEATPRTSHGDGDHERFAHYVRKEKILESALSGDAVIALCGKVWVPGRDPARFPVCPACKEIYDSMPAGKDPSEG